MSGDYPRSHRVADYIQRELAELIRTELKDPGISPMLTIASVEVSRDLSTARVYYSVFDADERADTQEALGRAAHYLRKQLASRMSTRSVPALRFYYDDSAEQGARMSALIADAVATNTTVSDDVDNPDAESIADADIGVSGNPDARPEASRKSGQGSEGRLYPDNSPGTDPEGQ